MLCYDCDRQGEQIEMAAKNTEKIMAVSGTIPTCGDCGGEMRVTCFCPRCQGRKGGLSREVTPALRRHLKRIAKMERPNARGPRGPRKTDATE
jgi:hypothetical protein